MQSCLRDIPRPSARWPERKTGRSCDRPVNDSCCLERLEPQRNIRCEAVVKEPLRAGDSLFVGKTDVEMVGQPGAKANAHDELRDTVGFGGTEVDDIVSFRVNGKSLAIRQNGEPVGNNKRNKEAVEEIVSLDAVVQNGALSIAVDWQTNADVGRDMEVAKSFCT